MLARLSDARVASRAIAIRTLNTKGIEIPLSGCGHSLLRSKTMKLNKWFAQVAETVSHAAGHAVSFIICCLVVVVWAAVGPIFKYSDTWQLVINTGTTIVTFLMVFLIQNTQNRDGAAIQAKLDELVRVTAASNSFIGIEHLTVEEVNAFRQKCKAAADKAGKVAVQKAGAKARKAADKAV
jgi:low affinity Fe/Cu permease